MENNTGDKTTTTNGSPFPAQSCGVIMATNQAKGGEQEQMKQMKAKEKSPKKKTKIKTNKAKLEELKFFSCS